MKLNIFLFARIAEIQNYVGNKRGNLGTIVTIQDKLGSPEAVMKQYYKNLNDLQARTFQKINKSYQEYVSKLNSEISRSIRDHEANTLSYISKFENSNRDRVAKSMWGGPSVYYASTSGGKNVSSIARNTISSIAGNTNSIKDYVTLGGKVKPSSYSLSNSNIVNAVSDNRKLDFDKVDFNLDKISKSIEDLKKSLDVAEKNIGVMVDYSILDKDISRLDKAIKDKNQVAIDKIENERKKVIEHLIGNSAQTGLVGKLKSDLNRAINVRNAILEANGISKELYSQYSDYVGKVENQAKAFTNEISDDFGEFVSNTNNTYVLSSSNSLNKGFDKDVINKYHENLDNLASDQKQAISNIYSTVDDSRSKIDAMRSAELSRAKKTYDEEVSKAHTAYISTMSDVASEVAKNKAKIEDEFQKALNEYKSSVNIETMNFLSDLK